MKNWLKGAGVMTLALALSACGGGGGGVNTTPAQPTPTPTPTPPPTGVNASLLAPLASETFINDAVKGTASYPTNGSDGTSSVGSTTLTFVYDATSNRYTVTEGGNSRSFGAANIDTSLSNNKATVYQVTNGSTTDSLYLTKPAQSGNRAYQYVGAGFLQRTSRSSGTIAADLHAFTYGAQTLASEVPRTGNATYDIFMKGLISFADQPVSLEGDGTMVVRFADATFNLYGTASRVLVNSGQANGEVGFSGYGTVAGSGNGFTGTMDANLGGPNTGTLSGRFYGPNATELGAVWTDSVFGASAAGTILGRKQTAPNDLMSAPATYSLGNRSQELSYSVDAGDNPTGPVASGFYSANSFTVGGAADGFAYRITSAPYAPAMHTVTYQASDKVAAESSATWDVYRQQSNGGPNDLRLFRTSSANPVITLSYTSFGIWSDRLPDRSDAQQTRRADRFFLVGLPTDQAFRPASGTASYNGKMIGYAYGQDAGRYVRLNTDGAFTLNFDFTANSMKGALNGAIVGTDGVRRDFATLDMSGNLHPAAVSFSGNITGGGFYGAFFGPNLNEVGATFQTSIPNPADSSNGYSLIGALVGRKN